MASNLASIGFAFEDAEAFQEQMLALAAQTIERLDCEAGDYAIWRSRTGAEIWFHLAVFGHEDNAQDIAGLTPFFEGESEVAIEVVERVSRADDNAFEGAFRARRARLPQAGDGGDAWLEFDAVDFAAHAGREVPFACQARIVGFARSVRRAGGGEVATLTGTIVDQRRLVNEASGQAFVVLQLDCDGAEFDVVADPAIVAGDIASGVVVDVVCALFGRLID